MKNRVLHLRTQLSFNYACIVLLVIAAISFSVNQIVRYRFEKYMESVIEHIADNLQSILAEQYNPKLQSWDIENIQGIGMYAISDGCIIKVYNNRNELVWDIESSELESCRKAVQHFYDTIGDVKSDEIITYHKPIFQQNTLIGYVEVSGYPANFFDENAFWFLRSINVFMAVSCVLLLGIAILGGFLLANRITSPITNIIEQTKQISEGHYIIKPDLKAPTLEIRKLSESVAALADTISKQEQIRKQLTADVAHELRTPLTNAASQLEMMSDGIWEPTPARIASCYEEISRITGLVEDMEKLHQMDSDNLVLHKSDVSVQEMLQAVVYSFEKELTDRQIQAEISGGDFTVLADWDRLIQVMTNLVSNAVKYTEQGGSIQLMAEHTGTEVRMTVRDSGIGISAEDLPYVFDRFYRADKSRNRSTGGSGIGLAISRSIAEAHGGSISVDSQPGKGSSFTVTLPAAQ